jgi:tricarballylate dehydrogenase
MVGGIFSSTHPGGTGLKNGSVFGKLAGQSAAEHVVGNA